LKHPQPIVRQLSHLANQFNRKRVGQARVEAALMATNPWLLSISNLMSDFARTYFALPEDHIVMLRYGIDLARYDPDSAAFPSREFVRAQWKIRPDQTVGMFIGHNWIRKGVPEAIEALGLLQSQGKAGNLVLLVVGRDDPHRYRRQAQRLGVADRVIFAGIAGDPRPFYRAADFLLLPTRQDTCSIVVLEALTMGLPVITTMQNGASELIEPGRQGLLTERGDSPALARAMLDMLVEARRKGMAAAALAMRGQLSQDQHVKTVEALYQRVVAARNPPSALAAST
jgi:UDP-glucose:(heptosyl)LPS alpha-1,3-glucosyltransferase